MSQYSSLAISYANASTSTAVDDGYWIRLEQTGIEEDTATLAEVAELVDAVFELNPCVEPEETEEETTAEEQDTSQITEGEPGDVIDLVDAVEIPTGAIDEADYIGVVSSIFQLAFCGVDSGGNWEAQIKVWQSHPGESYALKFDNGKELSRVITECDIDELVTVEGVSGVTLDWPVLSSGTFIWSGGFVDADGNSGAGPTITRTGNTLNWEQSGTGSIRVQFASQYDLVTAVIYGDEDENPGECRVLGFYHGMVDELDLETPEPPSDDDEANRDTYCNTTHDWNIPTDSPLPWWYIDQVACYCQCSGEFDHYIYENVPTQADIERDPAKYRFPSRYRDKGWKYIDCNEVTGDMNTLEFYEQACCYPPPNWRVLPSCSIKHVKNGNMSIDKDIHAELVQTYGDDLKIIAVAPEDQDCGITTWNYVPNFRDCCDEEWLTPLEVSDVDTVEILANNSSGTIYFSGGKRPVTVTAVSTGLYTDVAKTQKVATVISNSVTVYSGDICGHVVVQVTDGCSTFSHIIKATTGAWEILPESQWPEPPGLTYYNEKDWDLSTTNTIYLIAEDTNYRYRQAFRENWCDYVITYEDRPEDWCTDIVDMQPLIDAQTSVVDNGVPRFISPNVFEDAIENGHANIYCHYNDGTAAGDSWYSCGTGIMCLDGYPYYAAQPHYRCQYSAAGFPPVADTITVWKWVC